MHTDSSISVKNHKGKGNSLAEVSNVERQLRAYVQSRGLWDADVQNLYSKAYRLYEQILLGMNELDELQEIEYSLWKLHYKHIEEFRKQTCQSSGKEGSEYSNKQGNAQEGFKLFLEESSGFYQDLISKIKRCYSFQEPTLFYHCSNISRSTEHTKLQKCRIVCHRLLVRLGDIARYLEVNQKPSIQQRNWSAVAKCYFEAAKMYPDGGNPHNQLALLATPTYIGDEFLALYHCVRSLAVKEPFTDASDNLLYIFERNRSVQIHSLSAGSRFNFLKPSERVMISAQTRSNGASDCNALRNSESACYLNADFWSHFVRVTSFFFLELSLESFSFTFASTIRELEALLAVDDAKLSIALESYQNVNISRPGPYRALQAVSILIYTVHNLSTNPELQCGKKLQMALTATFICMGRLVERCLKGISTDNFALLPAVMVFSEWLVEVLDIVEENKIDEKLMSATSYFFSSYVELLNQLHEYKNQVESSNLVALWEDYEMRAFIPVSQRHSSLDFFTYWENETDFRAKNECRVHRIIHAAIKLASRSTDDTQRWIFYEKGGKFCTKEAKSSMQRNTPKAENPSSHFQPTETHELSAVGMVKENHTCAESKPVAVEEEEDIVFKPITRHNSSPLSAYTREKEAISQHTGKELEPLASDESLRHASSRLIAQNRALIHSLTSHTGLAGTDPTSMLSTITEASPALAGSRPPSLSAWVLYGDKNDGSEEGNLKLINQILPESLSNFSHNNYDDRFGFVGSAGEASTSINSTSHQNYSASTPSAPLLPEDATWFTVTGEPLSSRFIDNSPLPFVPSTPPPWPCPLRDQQNLHWINNQNNGVLHHQYIDPSGSAGNLYTQEASSWTNHFDQRYPLIPSPAVYMESTLSLHPTTHFVNGLYNPSRDNVLFHHHHVGNERSNVGADEQYPKEREWMMQQEAHITPSTYKRN